jgi:hypothetical protein
MLKIYRMITSVEGMHALRNEHYKHYNRQRHNGCKHLACQIPVQDIAVEEYNSSFAYNYVAFVGGVHDYFRNDLFTVLEPYLAENFDFSSVVFQNEIQKDGMILWSKKPVFITRGMIRGRGGSCFWRCKYCGIPTYQTEHSEKKEYVLEQDAQNITICAAGLGDLLLNEEVHELLTTHAGWKTFSRKTTLREIPVFKRPLDNYPADLSQTPPEDERRPAWCTGW